MSEIIQNLLIFSRVQDLQSESIFDINELTQQILKISEIHAKALNVNLDWTGDDLLPLVRGNPSLTSQALRNLLQIGIDHASNKTVILKTRSLPSQLEWRLDIPDLVNAKNLDKENFSWSLARQILLDQGASLTVLSESEGTGCSLRILFTRLVFRS
ncbi:MAG: hypothetical protein IPK04_04900 [Bdellovibrionales bacterium]|nr:hypothetical protein [Bdellovibrionales bacterium]